MLRLTTLIVLVSGLCVMGVAGCSPNPPANPTLAGPASPTNGGSTIAITGQQWGASSSGCAPVVKATAYVEGISPFAMIVLPHSPVDAKGGFELDWQTPVVFQNDVWTVEASQTCRGQADLERTIRLELDSA
jgi:hypothetical protein